MKKSAKERTRREEPITRGHLQLVVPLAVMLRRELREFVVSKGTEALGLLLEEERRGAMRPSVRARSNGPPAPSGEHERGAGDGRPQSEGEATAGTPGRVGGDASELGRVFRRGPARRTGPGADGAGGLRKYRRSLEEVPEDLCERSTSKSAVSRRFKARTEKQLEAWFRRSLADLSLTAIMIDGLHVDDHIVLLALGIDEGGHKHILGLWEGATESKAVCQALLRDLLSRGLDADRAYLFVIDGSKALRSGIKSIFGVGTPIQHCQEHKKRNVLDPLPKHIQPSVRKAMNDAYASANVASAKRQLGRLVNRLEDDHPCAAASLREGLDETLTVKSWEIGGPLERTLSTTNAIENLNGRIRDTTRRVKRWRNGKMILRWVGASLSEAEKGFRKLRGYRSMPRLVAALRNINPQLASTSEAA